MKQNKKFLNLILNLLKYHTYSGNESIMSDFLTQEMQCLGFKVKKDANENIYGVRGKADKYPLLNAHMDIVFDVDSIVKKQADLKYVDEVKKEKPERLCSNCENVYDCASLASEKGGDWNKEYNRLCNNKHIASSCQSYDFDENWASYNLAYNYDDDFSKYYYSYDYNYSSKYSPEKMKFINDYLDEHYKINYNVDTGIISSNKLRILGGDDKCGIAIALQIAREMPKMPMKLLFTVEEETGCNGIESFCFDNAKWFDDIKYSLTIDRRGNDNLLMYSCGKPNCTIEFASQLATIGIKSGVMVKMEEGTLADVIYIRKYVENCVNISAGYFNPHFVDEYIDFWGMINIKNWVKNIIAVT